MSEFAVAPEIAPVPDHGLAILLLDAHSLVMRACLGSDPMKKVDADQKVMLDYNEEIDQVFLAGADENGGWNITIRPHEEAYNGWCIQRQRWQTESAGQRTEACAEECWVDSDGVPQYTYACIGELPSDASDVNDIRRPELPPASQLCPGEFPQEFYSEVAGVLGSVVAAIRAERPVCRKRDKVPYPFRPR